MPELPGGCTALRLMLSAWQMLNYCRPSQRVACLCAIPRSCSGIRGLGFRLRCISTACVSQVVEIAATEEKGGCKSASATISGRGVYGRLKFESGIHRVQRVPATEASGRLHTSAASVAILPQADEVTALCPGDSLATGLSSCSARYA